MSPRETQEIAVFTIFVHMNARREWLLLKREARAEFVEAELAPILVRHPQVKITFYDAEAFTTLCSDIATFETESLDEYAALMDELRDSKLFTVPYFDFVGIFPAKQADFV
jgi:hypothetical protein